MNAQTSDALVRLRIDGSDVVLTLTAQQAYELARAVEQTTLPPHAWLHDLARSLAETAGVLGPEWRPGRRRPLRIGGSQGTPSSSTSAASAGTVVATPTVPQTRPTPDQTAPRRPVRSVRRNRPASGSTPAKPVRAGAGLAAAVAVFAEAISLDDGPTASASPTTRATRRASTGADRAKALQEVLEAAARTAPEVPAGV